MGPDPSSIDSCMIGAGGVGGAVFGAAVAVAVLAGYCMQCCGVWLNWGTTSGWGRCHLSHRPLLIQLSSCLNVIMQTNRESTSKLNSSAQLQRINQQAQLARLPPNATQTPKSTTITQQAAWSPTTAAACAAASARTPTTPSKTCGWCLQTAPCWTPPTPSAASRSCGCVIWCDLSDLIRASVCGCFNGRLAPLPPQTTTTATMKHPPP